MNHAETLSMFEKLVIEHTIQDFYTPNIKAEVILDMLLAQYIPAIIEAATGKQAKLITKEMSIGHAKTSSEKENNQGKKVDYVAVTQEKLYLVELKTTQGSLGREQVEIYKKWIDKSNGKKGTDLLRLLCRILKVSETSSPYAALEKYLRERLEKPIGRRQAVCKEGEYDRIRKEQRLLEYTHLYQKKNAVSGSEKYIHTIACMLQNSKSEDWEKEIGVLYISPSGAKADGIQDITFEWIAENIDHDALRSLKESVFYNHIFVPLFLSDALRD